MENLNINEELSNFNKPSDSASAPVHKKLDELIVLLSDTTLDNDTIQELQKKINDALRSAAGSTAMQPWVKTGRRKGPEDETDAELEQLLFINKLDKPAQRRYTASQMLSMLVRVFIALLLILLGFGMIIMPAPPYFEMFTLFYLNPNDGVTIMDVISLIVAFTGVYILISTIARRKVKR